MSEADKLYGRMLIKTSERFKILRSLPKKVPLKVFVISSEVYQLSPGFYAFSNSKHAQRKASNSSLPLRFPKTDLRQARSFACLLEAENMAAEIPDPEEWTPPEEERDLEGGWPVGWRD